jgi:TfoX/Sxy family transcriptional regulator of competence genes
VPTPSFSKSSPEMVARFDDLAANVPEATRKHMFGYPSLVLHGNMFLSLFGDALVLRLSESDRREFVAACAASPFEPMPGRPMREYLVAPPDLVGRSDVEEWVRRSAAYAAQLPPKQPKPRKKTT